MAASLRKIVAPDLRCPSCRAERGLRLTATEESSREVRSGSLACPACGARYAIRDGIVDLLYKPPEFVVREAAGLARFAEKMRQDGWNREMILSLPDVQEGYWYTQGTSMKQLCREIPFRPGQRLLDVGSNTCWASNRFASMGLDVVALDIVTVQLQGLLTAEYFFEATNVYFERVLGTMFALPLATGIFDYVYCCEVLHHNDRETLARTFREAYRILKPGGQLLVINETMKFPMDLKPNHAKEVAQYEGYEHTFFFHEYYFAARRAGFSVSVLEPIYLPFFRGDSIHVTSLRGALRAVMSMAARRTRMTRRLYLAYRNLVAGGVALNLVCQKSARGSAPSHAPADQGPV